MNLKDFAPKQTHTPLSMAINEALDAVCHAASAPADGLCIAAAWKVSEHLSSAQKQILAIRRLLAEMS